MCGTGTDPMSRSDWSCGLMMGPFLRRRAACRPDGATLGSKGTVGAGGKPEAEPSTRARRATRISRPVAGSYFS
jgi:hypothetical protein